ncbi:hypothetical protein RHSIM_Rhsim01G0110200 [Rhododendron simsii]|uniref:FLZ-type domain-containing protein n=1 Tax=Rhododendron simsii TaxID=118357 RepID=A0A834LZ71_RHOSS|nr:hypothetical protein RHSIM_Rhsim01G0110200 [Rhododendron simsii]
MADLKVGNKKILTINLNSLFPSNDHKSSTTRSPKIFNPNGVVGLGIVAAMKELDHNVNRSSVLTISPKSNPIPIVSSTKFGGPNLEEEEEAEEEEMELSEEYTCVISHMGNNLIKKREYFDGVLANESETTASEWAADKAAPVVFRTADFLNSCYLCRKQLHGLDIFMYRYICNSFLRCFLIGVDGSFLVVIGKLVPCLKSTGQSTMGLLTMNSAISRISCE